VLFSIQFGSSRKVAIASWFLFKADGVACCTTLSMCLSSYIGRMADGESSELCGCLNTSVLGPNTLSLAGWAVQNS